MLRPATLVIPPSFAIADHGAPAHGSAASLPATSATATSVIASRRTRNPSVHHGSMADERSFQEQLPDNHCFGCGTENHLGLGLRSRWVGAASVATWSGRPEHAAGPRHILNGGIIATLLDCHGVCTAIADAYRDEDRPIGSDPEIWYATSNLSIEYLRPTPLAEPLTLHGEIVERDGRLTIVACTLTADGKERARGRVMAVRVPTDWKRP
jgi:acyl-coenzyme A thioesterase PaaI-like protein